MLAIIRCGGKQYRVEEGTTLKVETGSLGPLAGEDGKFACTDVLFVADGDDRRGGAPLVAGARVVFTSLGAGRADKIRVFKKKRRKQYRRTAGHRQNYDAVRVERIELG